MRTSDALEAFDVAWRVIGQMRQLDRGSDKRMVQALRDDDVRLQQFAIVRLGERRARSAVKPLCKMLAAQNDAQMLYRIMGALVAIGDTRAVTPLIDLARRKDDSFLSQVVFAVGAIGGRTARAYLVVLASGHPSEQVQQSAKEALGELLQRQPAAQR
jgi:HEAT repeat protein